MSTSLQGLLTCVFALGIVGAAEAKTFYKVDFEAGDTTASVGTSKKELISGSITAVPNPAPDAMNSSSMVGRVRVSKSSSKTRAELSSQRLPTNGKTYRYRWSSYYPKSMLNGVTLSWLVTSQWKTWPCEVCNPTYDPAICGGCGGIFNEARVEQKKDWEFRWRAEPDCHDQLEPIAFDRWVRFEMLVYWTKGSTGYVRLWRDGKLVKSIDNIRTLFTSFVDGQCDMYWALGIYASWSGTPSAVEAYIDNIEISDDVTPPQLDAGLPDAAGLDLGVSDAGIPDAGGPDARAPDAATPDVALTDAAPADAGASDTSVSDAGPDARGDAAADAGSDDSELAGGCAHGHAPFTRPLLALLVLGWLWARRRGKALNRWR
jgi:hypothetical protein